MGEENEGTLQIADWLVIGVMLAASAAVGVYYRFTGGRQQTTGEYFSADRSTGPVLISIAMMVSFISGPTLLGLSAECYTMGIQYNLAYLGMPIASIIVAYFYLPVFYELNTMSVFQYLEKRFGMATRILGSATYFVKFTLYTGVVMFAPSLALETTIGLDRTVSILLNALICTFYATIGGIKAVITTDVIQATLMFACIFAIIGVALKDIEGGFWTVLQTSYESDRINLFTFDFEPTVRYNVLNLITGGMLMFMYQFGSNQVQIQRMLTAKTLRAARWGLWMNVPLTAAMIAIISFAGLTLHTYYKQCDPVSAGQIKSYDMLMPYFATLHLTHIPGLTGIFVAGIFSASLSTVSAALNSLAALALTDYLRPILRIYNRDMTDKRAALVGKFLTVIVGGLALGIAFISSKLGNLLQLIVQIYGAIGSPILGLFTLGMFFESTNQVGVIIGTSLALVLNVYTALSPKPRPKFLPMSMEACTNSTIITQPVVSISNQSYFYLNRISFMWYPALGWSSTVIFGIIASAIVNCLSKKTPPRLNDNLFTPFVAARIRRRREKEALAASQVFILQDKTFENNQA